MVVTRNKQKVSMSNTSVIQAISIGVAVRNNRFVVVTRDNGKASGELLFGISPLGQSSLSRFIASLDKPARIAVSSATAAAVALAFALSAVPGREIALVASSHAEQSADLARYAERSI